MNKIFYTIRETAKTGILSEHCLRIMLKEGKIPHIKAGKKHLINYPLLLEQLTKDSQKAVIDAKPQPSPSMYQIKKIGGM